MIPDRIDRLLRFVGVATWLSYNDPEVSGFIMEHRNSRPSFVFSFADRAEMLWQRRSGGSSSGDSAKVP